MNTTVFAPRVLGQRQEMKLVMQSLLLTGRILPVGARLWIRHEFKSSEAQPVEVVYGFVLPRDAALRRFRISGEGFAIASELKSKEEARKTYEAGISDGSLSGMASMYGDGLVNLSVGNIRPQEKVVVLLEMLAGVELHDDGLRLRFPFTLAPLYHANARVIEAEHGLGEMELPDEEFGDLILPRFSQTASDLHAVGFSLEVQLGDDIREIGSPSHSIRVERDGKQITRVSLSRDSDLPDRDLVLDIRKQSSKTIVLSGLDADGKGRFAAVLPSTEFGPKPSTARRVVMLLDRSGSMQGRPIQQAKKAIEACLGALDKHDQFGLVVFSNGSEVFREHLDDATTNNRRAASKFLEAVSAGGGTEISEGLNRATALLGGKDQDSDEDGCGDILIITDGQVFGTEAILERIRSTGARVHCLGIGSASQDRFLAQLASQTGGVSRFITPAERVDLPAIELFGAIGRPVAEILNATIGDITGAQIAPKNSKYVFSGTPLVVFGDAPTGGEAEIELECRGHADTSKRGIKVKVPLEPAPVADTLKLLQGSRIISDLESRCVRTNEPSKKRELSRVQQRLAELSIEYGLATSETPLVAVVKRSDDREDQVPSTRVIAVGMPQDMDFSSLFGHCDFFDPAPRMAGGSFGRNIGAAGVLRLGAPFKPSRSGGGLFERMVGSSHVPEETTETSRVLDVEDLLVAISGMLEPDRGMPGANPEMRMANSLVTLLFFRSQNNTEDAGVFRMHVQKLMDFLSAEWVQQLNNEHQTAAVRILDLLKQGKVVNGPWEQYVRQLVQGEKVNLTEFWLKLDIAVAAGETLAKRQNASGS